ncbi:MAG: response regulator [Caulobacteraceae bacterium]
MVLTVDDDAVYRNVLARALRREGLIVHEASDGNKARALLERISPEILITDILMPDCDGLELITAAKRLRSTTRIVAMSGRWRLGRLDLLDLAKRIGADAIYPKSLDVECLVEIIRQLIKPPTEH